MGTKLTSEEVIKRIKETHGDTYDLSKVVYVNRRTKLEVICKTHGSFDTRLEQLERGQGCPECGLVSRGEKRRLTPMELITRFREVHRDRYNYSKVYYQGMVSKVVIICPEHGEFEQTPSSHLNGSGCPECGFVSQISKRRLSTEDFISRSIEEHGYRYDYSNVKYLNGNIAVEIGCRIHGVFNQRPDFHMRGSGCPKCSILEQQEKQTKTSEEFIRESVEVHGNLYDYSLIDYINSWTPVIVVCKTHGEFKPIPNNHLRGSGCPKCNSSKGEVTINSILSDYGMEYYTEYKFDDLIYKSKLKCDFFIPSINLVLEYNGEQHYKPNDFFGGEIGFLKTIERDRLKKQYCLENGINYEVIRFDEDTENRVLEILLKYGLSQ